MPVVPSRVSYRRLRELVTYLFYVFLCATIVWAIALPLIVRARMLSQPRGTAEVDPGPVFTQMTGLKWPETAKIISVGDTHGGFHGDGEFHVVFETDPGTIDTLLHASKFQRGPIPHEIGTRGFGDVGGDVVVHSTNGGPWEYAGDPQMISRLNSSEVWYKAEDTCCQGMRWHNGTLLILDPRDNRVWFAKWDY